jgi:predicted RNase H-like HicB family nuclease
METNTAKRENLLHVIFHTGEDGYIVAECLEISGCMSQGKTREEAERNIVDAIKACFGVMLEDYLRRSHQHLPARVGTEERETFRVTPPDLEPVGA